MDERNIVNGRYNGWAAYVDLSYQINDLWDVSLGVRYTYDEKKFSTRALRPESMLQNYFLLGYMTEQLTDKNDWSQVTPRLIVRYMPNDGYDACSRVTPKATSPAALARSL